MTASALGWLRRMVESPALDTLGARLRAQKRLIVEGAAGSSATLAAGALAVRLNRPVLMVVAHLDEADDAYEDLALFPQAGYRLPRQRFSALEILPGESNISLELLAERLAVVENLLAPTRSTTTDQRSEILIAPIQALMQPVPEPGALGDFSITLETGREFAPARLFDWLDRAGYRRTDTIEQPGDFSTRGGIVDLYLPSSGLVDDDEGLQGARGAPGEGQGVSRTATATAPGPLPPTASPLPGGPIAVRLDYFGDDIESIRLIDTESMGSGPALKRVQVIGASLQRLQSDERTTGLLNLMPADTLVVLHESLELAEQARGYFERLTNPRGIISPQALIQALTAREHVQLDQFGSGASKEDGLRLPVSPLPSFAQDAAQAVKELGDFAQSSRIVVLCQKDAERERLAELLQQHAPEAGPSLTLEMGYLHRGFVWEDSTAASEEKISGPARTGEARTSDPRPQTPDPLLLVPHHELFHRYLTRRRVRKLAVGIERASDAFFDLGPGDYVVHVDHGIARFAGIKTMKKGGVAEDYLTLEFAGSAVLHVPAAQIDLIQKYIGGFEGRPPLSILGGKRWEKQKQEVAQAVKDVAKEMLQIQAARAALPGVRFPSDTAWQKEFEAEFPYEETEDQLAAIAAMKKNMADEQPMDRLICGDVGFGKTEIAIRAAFKAAEFGKQVAVLVPTTVLAEQHEETFRGRMADYPFRVASLSRFKSGAEQSRIVADLAQGKIDILIGTHRILSEDVRFADLGLVVIDEEQRFGVEHKHKLLKLRLTADVLTLTATPIPRTLHMALLGLRDISSLSIPPADRRAIVTEVMPWDAKRIQRALVRELNRDGQVYFVHNRVHNIRLIADEVHKLVPDARIRVGHGQMSPHELEQVMLDFMRHKADILVCTTIIESGIDIPYANTIFINEADHYGLADLHQLRGRVGRWKNRAYCYLLLPPDRPVTEKAQKRLKAIEQYAMLGAGFKIAMRDLEIRGAGNILGREQSGHIAAVGYEMYCRLLEQEAKRLRHEQVVEPARTTLELPIHGRIPPGYIPTDKHRMEAYRRLSRAATLPELDAVAQDLSDAYGKPPELVQRMIDLTELRIAAGTLEIDVLKLDGPDLIFTTRNPQKLDQLFRGAPGRTTLVDERTVYYRPPANYLAPPATLLSVLRKLLVRPVRG